MGSGEEAASVLSDLQQAVLTAICDTAVPSLPRDRDPEGLWGRKASDIGVDLAAAQLISEIPDPELRGGRRFPYRDDPLPPLRRSRPPAREEPELGGLPLPGPGLRAARAREAAQSPRAGGLGGDARG